MSSRGNTSYRSEQSVRSQRSSRTSRRPTTGDQSWGKSPPRNTSQSTGDTSFGSRAPTSSFTEGSDLDRTLEEPKTPPLPAVNERLAYLRPSRELLEYYRKKIAEFDDEHDQMVTKLDQYKMTYEEQHKVQWELRQREEEIAELQKALSDMQVYLFQEREHVLRLYAENDRLKIRELEDRKKIQALLTLSGLTESEVSYFMKEPPAKAIVDQRLPAKLQQELTNKKNQGHLVRNTLRQQKATQKEKLLTQEEEKQIKDNQTLALQVDALRAQLEEQTKLAKEQVDALLEDRRVKSDEFETRRQRDMDKMQTTTEKLHKTQDLLYDSTKDFLELRFEHRAHERTWMGEKDRFLRELDLCRQQLTIHANKGGHDVLNISESSVQNRIRQDEEIKALDYQCKQAEKLADMYREQVIQLEDKLARIREEGDIGKELFKERSEKMAKRLELMNQRYTDLERRRNLEVEGFKNDIKQLRGRLKDLEKQLYKVTIGFNEDLEDLDPNDIDMQILRNVRNTAARSKNLMGGLKTLKSKVYGMENDLRHL